MTQDESSDQLVSKHRCETCGAPVSPAPRSRIEKAGGLFCRSCARKRSWAKRPGPGSETLSLRRAAATRGLRLASLREAIERGAVRATPVVHGGRTWYRLDAAELDEDLARLRCRRPGCDRVALGESGGCSPAHGAALALTGRERPPEVVAKIAEAIRRYPAEERFCATCGKSLGIVSEAVVRRGKAKYCSTECAGTSKYRGEERFCEYCGEGLGFVPGWIIRSGGGRFCNRSHAKKWEAANHPEKFRRDGLRTGRDVTCPGCGGTRYYSPADVPRTGYCARCLPASKTGRDIRAAARVGVRDQQLDRARDDGVLRPGELLLADVAPRIGVSRPMLTSYLIRRDLLQAERREIGGVSVWVVRAPALRDFRKARAGTVDVRGRANPWRDPGWVQAVALDRGWDTARAAKLGVTRSEALVRILRAVDARRRRPAGRESKDELRDQLRAIALELDEKYVSLSGFGENEILAEIGELAWTRGVDDFRQKYPPARFGDFHLQYRGNVVARVRGLIGADVKALLTAEKES